MARLHSLLIGIDRYLHPRIRPLHGCENDILDFAAFISEQLPQETGQIAILLSTDPDERGRPTRENIIAAFLRVGNAIDQGDQVIVYYAGHGSRARRQDGGYVETLTPMDSRLDGIYDIRDFEVSALLQHMTRKTNDVTVILDSCHSSSGTRGDQEIVRQVSLDEREQPAMDPRISELSRHLGIATDPVPLTVGEATGNASRRSPRGLLASGEDGWNINPENRYIVLAACEASQTGAERRMHDDRYHGLLSWCLLDTVRRCREKEPVRWEAIFDRVRERVSSARRGQVPTIEGDLKRYVFGGRWEPRAPGFRVLIRDDRYALETGAVAGVLPGAIIGVYPSGMAALPEDPGADHRLRVATLEITSASALRADTSDRPVAAPGVSLRGHVVAPDPAQRLPVRLSGNIQIVQPALDTPFITISEPPVIEVRVDIDRWHMVRASDGRTIASEPIDLSTLRLLRKSLEHYARYWGTLTRRSGSRSLPDDQTLSVSLIDTRTGRESARAGGSYALRTGEEFLLHIRNTGAKPLYAIAVNCTDSVMVEFLYPYGEEAPIEPDGRRVIGSGWVSAMTPEGAVLSPTLKPFRAMLPDGADACQDYLRVFGTTRKPHGIRDQLELTPRLAQLVADVPVRAIAPSHSRLLSPSVDPGITSAPDHTSPRARLPKRFGASAAGGGSTDMPEVVETDDVWTVSSTPVAITR
jgi:hypothetical protein